MREFVESLKRLYGDGRINRNDVERQFKNCKISDLERNYILKGELDTSNPSFEG